ncbi:MULTISPECIES: MCE family protein [unclassified Dietzia]|uniref:MCE family protein n=1 Tax=unclassified Dietzia TaxID=2617939 RepID=UPI0015F7A188|nr:MULTISPECIES: MCE family protein [unclassified Dietzia]MBB1024756.1 MCE family protein [Dietzia sp. DQ12-76]MBB1027282.1 MCE family protein [Dietzia sp. DQ11-38-2]
MNELSAVSKRLLAALFIVIVLVFVGTTIAIYNRAFTASDSVTMYTDDMAFALPNDADVKARGVLVGRVSGVEPEGQRVRVNMEFDPAFVDQLPANISGRLLPKTLFGERYVALGFPEQPVGTIEPGATIEQDTRGNAIELGRVLDGLLPVLEAVPPEKLAGTLGAINQALAGRGDEIGAGFVEIGRVFDGISEEMPALESGLEDLATFSQTYSEALPDLIHALDALRTTGDTVIQRRTDIADGLQRISSSADVLTGFLADNRSDLIALAIDSRTSLEYLAEYSPALPCTVDNFMTALDRSDAILGVGTPNPGIRVTIEVVNPKGRYVPNQDEPRFFDTRGPRCYDPAVEPQIFGGAPGGAIADGSYQTPTRNPGPEFIPTLPNPLDQDGPVPALRTRGSVPAAPGRAVPEQPNLPFPSTVTAGRDRDVMALAYAGSPLETDTVRTVYGVATDRDAADIPAWIGGIGAPALRGTEVSFR